MNGNVLYLVSLITLAITEDAHTALTIAWVIAALQDYRSRSVSTIGAGLIILLSLFNFPLSTAHTFSTALLVGVLTLSATTLYLNEKITATYYALTPPWALLLFFAPDAAVIAISMGLAFAIFVDEEVPLATAYGLSAVYALMRTA